MHVVLQIDPLLLPATYEARTRRLPCEARDNVQQVKGFITQLFGVPFLRQELYLDGVHLHDDLATLASLGVFEEAAPPAARRGYLWAPSCAA
ncbi:unnamed protein product [Effrenium voratum]|nr:unnamed protein product [Effrenium voratum]